MKKAEKWDYLQECLKCYTSDPDFILGWFGAVNKGNQDKNEVLKKLRERILLWRGYRFENNPELKIDIKQITNELLLIMDGLDDSSEQTITKEEK